MLEPGEFIGERPGCIGAYNEVPTYIQFFEKFWTYNMLTDILIETNRYAGSLDEAEVPMDRKGWYPVTVRELKAFLACSLYIDMKKLPNKKAY